MKRDAWDRKAYDRIITHDDMDGVVSAAICSYVFPITDIRFAGPNAIIKGTISTTDNDIVCDLPYPVICGMWFDHHEGNLQDLSYRNVAVEDVAGMFAIRDSCSRVVYEYFSNGELPLPRYFEQTVAETDVIDSFSYSSVQEWLRETPGTLVDYSIKASSTTLREKRRYMRELVSWVREHPLEEVIAMSKVNERVESYKAEESKMLRFIEQESAFLPYDRNAEIVIIDLTKHNRRPRIIKNLAYILYPEALAALEIHNTFERGVKTTNLGFAMSISISAKNNQNRKDLGEIMRTLNIGDGHKGAAAGTVATTSKMEMVKTKDELLRRIYELWISQT